MNPVSKGSDRPSRKKMRQLGVALVMSTAALDAGAAGLGRLNLMSGIGQPLRAEIEVTALNKDEIGSLSARLASPDAFGQAGIEYGSALSGLRFSVQRRAGGQAYVLVTSNALVNDPYLDLLVELSWSSGRLVREYTMLLDPPETRAARTEVEPGQTIVQARSPNAAAAAPASPRASSSPTGGAAAPSAPAAPRAAPAAGASSGSDYVVQSGDTALSIARANKVDNASLEQMLAALYRDNPQAFGGNINRLMAGATVKLPDATTAQAIDGPQARRIIAQSANFGRYRERIAQNASTAPASRADGQQASGRLTAQVQDNGAPAADARDRLQLSRPDATRRAAPATGPRTGAAGPSSEEVAAKDRELTESRSRLAQLEKNVADLQQLLKLKNQTLADLQKAAGKPADTVAPAGAPTAPVSSAPATIPPAVTPPAPVAVTPAPAAAAPVTSAPVTSTPTAPAAESVAPPVASTPAPAPAPAPTPAPAPAATKAAPSVVPVPDSDGAWYDALLDNSLLLAGLIVLVVLLVGYAVVTMLRRRKLASFEDSIFVDNSVLHANSVFGTTGGQSVDTANSAFHSNFVPVAGSLPDQSEVDPVAEADVYIAYGRDAQAEEILKEALRGDGTRHAVRHKLLEIYARRGDVKSFETTASELYALTGGEGDDWKQAATLGASIDPRNPLYGEPVPASPPASMVAPAVTAAPPNAARGAALAAAQGAFLLSGMGDGLSSEQPAAAPAPVDHTRTDPLPRSSNVSDATPPSMDLDFDLGFGNAGVTPLQTSASAGSSTVPSATPPSSTSSSPTSPSSPSSTSPSSPSSTSPSSPSPQAPLDDAFDFNTSESSKPMVDPFTASAFGGGDPAVRTAVNLPAFRARGDQPPAEDRPAAPRVDDDGFTASDIFGSSIIASEELYSEVPPQPAADTLSAASFEPLPLPARAGEFRHNLDPHAHAFEKTEPLDAFNKINLDLDTDDFAAPAGSSGTGATDFGANTEVWQAMATKLDLALAYSDIGDKDGARELLEEVVRNGDDTQSDRARTLIGQLD